MERKHTRFKICTESSPPCLDKRSHSIPFTAYSIQMTEGEKTNGVSIFKGLVHSGTEKHGDLLSSN